MGVTKAFIQSSGTWWDDRDYLLLRRELPEDYGRTTIRPSGLVWLSVVYNSLVIPAFVIEMGDIQYMYIDGIWLGVWLKTLSHRFSCACMRHKSLDTRSQFLWKTWPQIIIYWQITGSRMHDRVYMCSLRHPSLIFYTRKPSCVFVCWVLSWYLYHQQTQHHDQKYPEWLESWR